MFKLNPSIQRPPARLADAAVLVATAITLFAVLQLTRGMIVPFSEANQPVISLQPTAIPYYAGRSLLRMFLALGASTVFALGYGYATAYSRARPVLLAILDILQSVPILGFLSVTVVGFMALFPGRLLGVELASIFAIFTSMAWNMAFSFYNSLATVPKDLKQAAAIYRLGAWQRFVQLEVPFAMIGLVWNGMMSFGGAWFFLAASEAISVLHKDIKLPGMGSFIAEAIAQGDNNALGLAVLTMILLVVLVDALFWRPIVAWSQKFKFEQSEAADAPRSRVLTFLQRSQLVDTVQETLISPLVERLEISLIRIGNRIGAVAPPDSANRRAIRIVGWTVVVASMVALALQLVHPAATLIRTVTPGLLVHVLGLGALTLGRVLTIIVLSTLIWTPIGVWIGSNPRVARVAQPIVQVLASFPAVVLFPLLAAVFLQLHIGLGVGGMILMGLGSQWYILFNVIAGAMAIPTDMREAAAVFGVRGRLKWLRLILPGIFPFWVTGGVTAAGGAWNASIVAEIVSWKDHTLIAPGLGSYIAQATTAGDWTAIGLGIAVMSVFVVGLNNAVWRPLYALAESKFRLDS